MAIDYNSGISSLDAGASDITYSGDEGPKSPEQERMMSGTDTPGFELQSLELLLEEFREDNNGEEPKSIDDLRRFFYNKYGPKGIAKVEQAVQQSQQMASREPMNPREEYDSYVEQQQDVAPHQIMPFEEWYNMTYGAAEAGMAEGGIARLGYQRGQLVQPGPGRPGYRGWQDYAIDSGPTTTSSKRDPDPVRGDQEADVARMMTSMGLTDDPGGPASRMSVSDIHGEFEDDPGAQSLATKKSSFIGKPINIPDTPSFLLNMGLNFMKKPFSSGSEATRRFFLNKVLGSKNYANINWEDLDENELEKEYQNYMSARMAGDIDAYGNTISRGDGPGDQALPNYYAPRDVHPGTGEDGTEIEPIDEFDVARQGLIYSADGGRAGYAGGGITDLRQAYGLGKFVKKIGRKAKKALKNPLVQAALMAYGLKGFGGDWGLTSGWGLGKSDPMRTGLSKLFMKGAPSAKWLKANPDITTLAGWKKAVPWYQRLDPWTSIGIPSLIGGAKTWLDEKDEDEDKTYQEWLAKNKYWLGEIGEFPVGRGEPLYQRGLMATGGRIGYDHGGYYDEDEEDHRAAALAAIYRRGAQEGGLMNLGGMEKDYRQEGGFVPLGGEERADDVPARLSKNEFVFTADAVRAAGGGDIDAGAEIMENVMENLEEGGQVSEESQGLEGARDMFSTAQRLEGVL